MIPKSEVGILSSDSGNVVNLIQEAYNVSPKIQRYSEACRGHPGGSTRATVTRGPLRPLRSGLGGFRESSNRATRAVREALSKCVKVDF